MKEQGRPKAPRLLQSQPSRARRARTFVRRGAIRSGLRRRVRPQFNGTFLPPLYSYSDIAGFFNSPSASKPIFAVTPW